MAGHRLPVATSVLRVAAAGRRLRHQRLHGGAAGVRHGRRLQALPRFGARPRHPRDRGLRDEPHVRPASVVPGQPPRSGRTVRRLLCLERRRHPVPGRPDHLRRHRAVQLDLRSRPQAVLLAPLLQPPAGSQLRFARRAGSRPGRAAVLGRPRHRRVPARRRSLPVRAGRDERGEPAGDPRLPEAGPQGTRRGLPRPRAAVRSQPVARRRRGVLRRSVGAAATNATWRSTSR